MPALAPVLRLPFTTVLDGPGGDDVAENADPVLDAVDDMGEVGKLEVVELVLVVVEEGANAYPLTWTA